MNSVGAILLAIVTAIPAIEKILNNPAISTLIGSVVGLFTKTEAEKAVEKIKKTAEVKKKTKREMKVAIRKAKESQTKKIEDIWNRR